MTRHGRPKRCDGGSCTAAVKPDRGAIDGQTRQHHRGHTGPDVQRRQDRGHACADRAALPTSSATRRQTTVGFQRRTRTRSIRWLGSISPSRRFSAIQTWESASICLEMADPWMSGFQFARDPHRRRRRCDQRAGDFAEGLRSPCTGGLVTGGAVTHFEIYAEEPAKLAEFYRGVFGWRLDKGSRGRLLADSNGVGGR